MAARCWPFRSDARAWAGIAALSTALACSEPAGGDAAEPAKSDRLPCDVAEVKETPRAACHGAGQRGGAPLSLVRASDAHAMHKGESVGARVLARVADDAMPMPPPPGARLSARAIATLRAWIDRGAAADPNGCTVRDPGERSGAGAAGRAGAPSVMLGPGSDWPMFGGDLENTRSSAGEMRIAKGSVATLARAWEFASGSTSSVPAVVDGVVYLPTWDAKLHALDAASGALRFSADLPHLVDSSPAVSARQIFLSDGHGHVLAVDRTSGAVQWSRRVDPHPETHLWSSPIYVEEADLIAVGVASYEEVVVKPELSFRGSVVALDGKDGRERWRLATTDATKGDGPGIAIWATVAVDRGRSALYVGSGNNYGQPASELSDALLAIDYASGELLWAEQLLPGDVFSLMQPVGPDYDIGATANLFTAGGADLVGVGSKSGAYVALERESGALRWMAQVSPGGLFGGVIAAAAFAESTVFVASNDPQAGDAVLAALDAERGGTIWEARLPAQTFSHVVHANGVLFAGDLSGRIAAFDAREGTLLWSDMLPDVVGSAVVSRGMLFVSYGYPISVGESAVGEGGVVAYYVP